MRLFVIHGADVRNYHVKQELYLVDPVLPMGGHAVLHGDPAHGKTQLATMLALDIANGSRFLGELSTRKGNVAYVQADMTEGVLHDRLMKIDDNAAGALSGCDFIGVDGLDILNEVHNEELKERIAECEPSLVIVDTLRKTHNLDENISNTPFTVYSAWREAAGPTPAILYLHHNRKPHVDDDKSIDISGALRGSSAWLADADLGMHIKKTGTGPTAKFTLQWSKSRTFDQTAVGEKFTMQMDQDTLLLTVSNTIDTYLRDAMRRNYTRDQIIGDLQNTTKFGKHALSRASAFRRIADYQPKTKAA